MLASKTMLFIGKWAFSNTTSNMFLSLDAATTQVVASQATNASSNQRFNAYGDFDAGFWLQANNGKYIIYSGTGYMATEGRDGTPALFTLVKSGSTVQLIEQFEGNEYFVNMSGTTVGRVPTDAPPPTTNFLQQSISPGLAQIQEAMVIHSADLSWAYMASANLSQIDFSGSNLSSADMSNGNLFEVNMQGSDTILSDAIFANAQMNYAVLVNSTAPGADFSNANMKYALLSKANLESSDFTQADLSSASMDGVNLTGATMNNVNLYGTVLIESVLANADLTKANMLFAVVDSFNIEGTNFTNAKLNKMDLSSAQISAQTNFTGAIMQNVRLNNYILKNVTFTGADLTDSLFDGSDLTGTDFSYATLTGASLRNNVKLYSATLSNATLTNADFTGAQLGAKQVAFTLPTTYVSDLNGGAITDAIRQFFQNAGYPLTNAATLTVRIPSENWVINDNNAVYTITNGGAILNVWVYISSNDAAVLAGAYMPNAIFTDANLYAVNMSGVNWYGNLAKADNADMEEVDLANANLGSMNFSQTRMYGCNLDAANLIEATLDGAYLTSSINKKQVSFAFANIQGATFQQAKLGGAVMTNSAVSLNEGPLFTLPSSYASDLDKQMISSSLRAQFQTNGYPVESNATVSIITNGNSWKINNSSNTLYPIYNIIKIGSNLYVSGGPIGVPLFDLPNTMASDFDAKDLTTEIQNAFSDAGYPLVSSAAIDQVIISGNKWHMTNINTDTTQFQKGYVEFYVIKNSDGTLHVYGSVLMIVRPDSTNTLEQVRIVLATTELTQDVMDATTTCPNGQKLDKYIDQRNTITWEQMMTAAKLPKPPACIPSPFRWCP